MAWTNVEILVELKSTKKIVVVGGGGGGGEFGPKISLFAIFVNLVY